MLRTIHTLKCKKKKKKKKVNDKSGMTSLSFEKSKKKKKIPYGRNVFIGILKSRGRARGVERGQLPLLTSPKPTPP